MRLYSGKVGPISEEVIKTLTEEGDIELDADSRDEAVLDVQSVLKEYLRMEREVGDEARDLLARRGQDHTAFGRTKRKIAEGRGFGLGEDGIGWIADQLLDMMMHSAHIEEIFSEDHEIRSKIAKVLRRHMSTDEDLDREVRRRIKNLQEGTDSWDIEYEKVSAALRKLQGLDG
ncbi:MAG: DUF507 family protein [Myxococcota bacterium]|jgi:hypothetical protein|nr:DUF507 family protein [Myxococcota bacterium]